MAETCNSPPPPMCCPWHIMLQQHLKARVGREAPSLAPACWKESRFFNLLGVADDRGLGCLGLRLSFAALYPGSAVLVHRVHHHPPAVAVADSNPAKCVTAAGGSHSLHPALRRTALFKAMLDGLPKGEFGLRDVPVAVLTAVGRPLIHSSVGLGVGHASSSSAAASTGSKRTLESAPRACKRPRHQQQQPEQHVYHLEVLLTLRVSPTPETNRAASETATADT